MKRASYKTQVFLVSFVAVVTFNGALNAQQKPEEPAFVPGELIVGYASEQDMNDASRFFDTANTIVTLADGGAVRSNGAQRVGTKSIKVRVTLPQNLMAQTKKDPRAELDILLQAADTLKKNDSRVRYVEPNWIMRIDPQPKSSIDPTSVKPAAKRGEGQVPNDQFFASGAMWQLGDGAGGINAVRAWTVARGAPDVVVAVIDTGLDSTNADIKNSGNVLQGTSFVAGEEHRSSADVETHGTHVAGTIGASATNNERMIAGVAWAVRVLPVRVFARGGRANNVNVSEGILWSVGKGAAGSPPNPTPANVINLSLGHEGACSGAMQDAIDDATAAGAVIVVAAGNSAIEAARFSPANCRDVISVAAGDHKGRLASYSNYGDVSVMAPGGDVTQSTEDGGSGGIWSTVSTNCQLHARAQQPICERYGVLPFQGTSMAAPHVSGALALALAKNPGLRGQPKQLAEKLRASLRPLRTDACAGKTCGPGYLDVARLLDAVGSQNTPPVATKTTPEVVRNETGGAPEPRIEAAHRPTQVAAPSINGKWISEDGDGPFEITGAVWRHPSKGKGDIEIDGDARKVHYVSHQGVVCSYRVKLIAGGERLVLTETDATQPSDFCPSGILNRVME